jgi:nitroreductase
MTDATTSSALHPLLARRTSPRAFDPAHELDDATLAALLEAARWAPSSTNAQPWRFLVGRRGDEVHEALVATLLPGNLTWAPAASGLLLVAAEVVDAEGRERRHAAWDAGQAVAHLTVQAEAMGLAVRQIGGFRHDEAGRALGIPERVEPMTIVAVGRRLDGQEAASELAARDAAPRLRKPLAEVAFSRWDTPLDLAG